MLYNIIGKYKSKLIKEFDFFEKSIFITINGNHFVLRYRL